MKLKFFFKIDELRLVSCDNGLCCVYHMIFIFSPSKQMSYLIHEVKTLQVNIQSVNGTYGHILSAYKKKANKKNAGIRSPGPSCS